MKIYHTEKFKNRTKRVVGQCHWCGDDVMGVTKKKYCSGRCQLRFIKNNVKI